MWRPPLNFVTIHYAYIMCMGLLCFFILLPEGNIRAIDAYLFGASASTESGLNPVDVKELRTYQQLAVYFIPMCVNIGFINIGVVVVRLIWFRKHLKNTAPSLLRARRRDSFSPEDGLDTEPADSRQVARPKTPEEEKTDTATAATTLSDVPQGKVSTEEEQAVSHDRGGRLSTMKPFKDEDEDQDDTTRLNRPRTRITFDPSTNHPRNDTALYIPGPRDRERGHPLVELNGKFSQSQDAIGLPPLSRSSSFNIQAVRRRRTDGPRIGETKSIDRVAGVATSLFVLGDSSAARRERRASLSEQQQPPPPQLSLNDMPFLSRQVTVGRNSQFRNLSENDREELGGIEYRSLKLLLKIVIAYFVGMHLLGVICLVPWIQYAAPKYKEYLDETGQNRIWWAIYSAQTMVNNLGLTLTPDSMISFRDAGWPMFIMSFLAFAGNTFYPVFLRLIIWTMHKAVPRSSALREPLSFLLDHPRRCYTLLFPSRPTWILCGILVALNVLDTLFIIALDLDNPAVTEGLSMGPRILAALFQAASARHTGTATFNLAEVSPAVQFSLLVMMYISVFPIAISIRASNTYEERSLGVYEPEPSLVNVDERKGASYLLKHMQNQLSFDLWYIFLGIFCISIAEAHRIMDENEPGIEMFPIFFEVTSAYANVGLSLGYPTVSTSLCGKLSTFSKVIICLTMIRGRHRGLPYSLDRAIMLPNERLVEDDAAGAGADDDHRSR
ncbi:Low-affinity potassium transport protein [Paramyrothecium foliicola]|nr:Low-affinity potassium transport protein [Paramyrothecium foliicola]